MSELFTTAGAKVDIGPVLTFAGTDFIATDFTGGVPAPTWVPIGGLTDMGTFGDTSQLVTSDQIGNSRTRKAKGVRNAGSWNIVADLNYADAGQLAVIAAEKVNETYSFRITFDDAPAGGTPSVRYFTALVMGTPEQLGGANDAMKLNMSLEIDSNVVRTAAAAA